ncbi:MAG: ParB/RepB/Spo0J family partition protein, partial [Acidimicrobiales bacterium]
QLIEDFRLTHDQVAQRVGKSRVAVTNTLRLFQLPPAIQKMVADGRLTAGHARALLGTPDRVYQEHLAQRVVTEGLSVREVEDAVRTRSDLAEATGTAASTRSPDRPAQPGLRKLRQPGLMELEQLFSEHLDTRVQVTMGARRGKVHIEFAGLEDLERLYRVITEGRDSD